MRLLNGVLFRLMVLALCLSLTSPALAGKADKAVKDDKAVKTEQVEKAEKKEAPKGNVAVVNGVAITQKDFDRELFGIQEQYSNSGEKLDDARLSEIKKKTLEKLIDGELLYQESQKMGLKVDDPAVDEQYAKFKEQFPNAEEFNKELVKTKLTEDYLKSQIKQAMLIQQFIDKKFVQKISVSEDEIKTFYESYLKERVEKNLKQEKIQKEIGLFLDKLKEKANVERNLP